MPTGIGGTLVRYLVIPLLISLFCLLILRKQWVLLGRWIERRQKEARAYRSQKSLDQMINQARKLS